MVLRRLGSWEIHIKFHLDIKPRERYKRARDKLKAAARRLIDRDRLNSTSQKAVGEAMVKLFATIQNQPRETQLLALAAAFVIQAEALGFSTNDTYAAVINLMKDPVNASRREHRFDAMKFHIQSELDERGDHFTPADGA